MNQIPVLSVADSQKLDRTAVDFYGISEDVLIANAGRACVDIFIQEKLISFNDSILILVGGGNNGSDGLVIARILKNLGYQIQVIELLSQKNQDKNYNLKYTYTQCGGIFSSFIRDDITKLISVIQNNAPKVIIDCLTGTGFVGFIDENINELISYIENKRKTSLLKVYSVDVPSFNEADLITEPLGFKADITISLQTLKKIHVEPSCLDIVGRVFLADIGIPLTNEYYKMRVYNSILAKKSCRLAFSDSLTFHKGNKPKILIIGGSEGKEGAGVLAAEGALRAGASLVTLCSASSNVFKLMPPEVMFKKITTIDDLDWINELIIKNDVVIIGPGLGVDNEELLMEVLRYAGMEDKPIIIDADAIVIWGRVFNNIDFKLPSKIVLTPHPKEFLSISNVKNVSEVLLNRHELVKKCSIKYKACIVLKGPRTLIVNEKIINVNPHIEPILAVGGSGDVLSGILASLIFRISDLFEAASLGVFLHSLAGIKLREDFREGIGAYATDIARNLPHVIDSLVNRIADNNRLYSEPFLFE